MNQKVTSVDVARAAGVSQSLVSLALNPNTQHRVKPETREKILDTAQKLGYHMNMNAKNMKVRRANAIGILSAWDMNSYVYAPIVSAAHQVCFENGYSLAICSAQKKGGTYDFKEYYFQKRIDGIVLISHVGFERAGLIEELEKEKIPYTCMIGCRGLEGVSGADEDFYSGGIVAAGHLAQRGYRKIIYVLKDVPEKQNYAEAERLAGCKEEAERQGLGLQLYAGFIGCRTELEYGRCAEQLLSTAGKTERCAVVSTSFECYSILKAAGKLGIRVPYEIGVMSFDNEKYAAYLTPPLTALKQPLAEISTEAVRMLMERLKAKEDIPYCVKKLRPELRIRQST